MPSNQLSLISEETENNCNDSLTDDKKLEWQYRDGFVENFDKIYNEFRIFRRARTVKVFITGPPGSGKTFFSQKIAENFNVPHISMETFINEQIEQKHALAEECKTFLANKKEEMVAEAKDQLEKDRAKKKKNLPEKINEEDYVPKLSDELLAKALEYRLNLSDCLNRGYVLDGYPKSYQQAEDLFIIKTEITEPVQQEDPDAEPQQPVVTIKEELNNKIMPMATVYLESSDEFIKQNQIKNVEDGLSNSKWNDENLARRNAVWKTNNVLDEKNKVNLLRDFQDKWQFQVETAKPEEQTEDEIYNKICEVSAKETAEYEVQEKEQQIIEVDEMTKSMDVPLLN